MWQQPRHNHRASRRSFVRIGCLSTIGIYLSDFLALAKATSIDRPRATGAILIDLRGGMSHLDSFDMKPNAPREIRGEFGPRSTNVPGLKICERLPRLAETADHYTIVRGMSHTFGSHDLARRYVGTGNAPQSGFVHPCYGAVVAKEIPRRQGIPPFVAIPRSTHTAGFLGMEYSAFETKRKPAPGRPVKLRGLGRSPNNIPTTSNRQEQLRTDLDSWFGDLATKDQQLIGLDQFAEQAGELIRSSKVQSAFDLGREKQSFAQPFGTTAFGASCLLAIRLLEAGTRFVTVTFDGWDTHRDGFQSLRGLLADLDQGLSALISGLELRGLLDSTLVVATGEFGRTPRINAFAGRDHHPKCMSLLCAGAGMDGGRVIGASDSRGELPAGHSYSPADLAASIYHCLGIDVGGEYQTLTGRPVQLVAEGAKIDELF